MFSRLPGAEAVSEGIAAAKTFITVIVIIVAILFVGFLILKVLGTLKRSRDTRKTHETLEEISSRIEVMEANNPAGKSLQDLDSF